MIDIAIFGKKLAQYAAFALMAAALSGCRDDNNEGDTSQVVESQQPPSEQPPSESGPAENSAPRISGSPATSVAASQSYSFQPAASDPDKDTLAFTIRNKPAWAAFNTATGRLSGTPDDGDAGTFSNIVIAVSDGSATAALDPFGITVSAQQGGAQNAAPKIAGTPATNVSVGAAYSFRPQGTDADGDQLTYSVDNLPDWAKFSAATGQLSGTPAAADAGTYSNIAISVSDGSETASLPTFAITVKQSPTGNATLSWTPPTENTDGSALTDLAGFRIRYGTSEQDLDQLVELDNPGLATYVVTDLHSGTWYFAVKAYSDGGAESELSNVASKTIP